MSEEAVFPNGLIFKLPRNGAPDFIKGSISIKSDELITFIRSQNKEWVNIDLKVSKNGKAYAQLNDWKPYNQQTSNNDFKQEYKKPVDIPAIFQDDIPF